MVTSRALSSVGETGESSVTLKAMKKSIRPEQEILAWRGER